MAGPIMQRVLRQVYEESQLWCLAFGDVYGLKLAVVLVMLFFGLKGTNVTLPQQSGRAWMRACVNQIEYLPNYKHNRIYDEIKS